jgi:hypothetical protein
VYNTGDAPLISYSNRFCARGFCSCVHSVMLLENAAPSLLPLPHEPVDYPSDQ